MKILVLALFFSFSSFATRGFTPDGFMITKDLLFERIADVVTTDATETVIHTKTMPDPSAWMVDVSCEARKSDGTKREGFKKGVLVYRDGGAAVIEGNIVNMFTQPGLDYSMTFGVSGNDFQVKVTGAVGDNVTWRCAFCKLKLE